MRLRALAGKTLRSLPFLIHRSSGWLGRRPQRGAFPSPEMLEGVRKILAIKLDSIGDLLMTTPALRSLRRRFPGADLHLLVQPGVAPLARLLPGVDAVETLPCGFLLSGGRRLARALRWGSGLLRMRRRRYDLILDFSGLFHSAAAAWAIGAPLRLGFRRRIPLGFFSTEGFGHFYTHEFEADERGHLAEAMSALPAALGAEPDAGGWRASLTPEIRAAAERALGEAGVGRADGPLVLVSPGTKWPPKRWAQGQLAQAIDLLQARGLRVLVTTGPGEDVLLDAIRRECRTGPAFLWPPVPLETLLGILEKADVFLGHDSGPMHLAAAVGTPVVALFGPTAPARAGPRGSPFIPLYAALECSPCPLYFTRERCHRGHNYCMDGFRPSDVAAAVELSVERRRLPRRAGGPAG